MCFSASLRKDKFQIEEKFDALFQIDLEYEPFYHLNGFTHGNLQIIPSHAPGRIYPASWGLVPGWANEIDTFRKKYNTLNAKIETVMESNTYGESIRDNRCLIIVDGFFEPHHENGIAIPYFCYQPSYEYEDGSSLFAFAGIYTEIGEEAYTCSILTRPANPFFEEIHNKKKRMPLVLDEHYYEDWLDDLNIAQVNELMAVGFTSVPFMSHPVSRDLYKRNIDTNKPYIIEPIDKGTLF